MSKGWTDERRKKQAERIRRQKPWEKSTGPKSDAGKRRSALNAYKHGLYTEQQETINALLKANRDFVRLFKQLKRYEEFWAFLEQTEGMFNEINDEAPRPPDDLGTK